MTTQHSTNDRSELDQAIEQLHLTVKTTRILRQNAIRTVGQLSGQTQAALAACGLSRQGQIEVRDVLASRGL